MAGSTPSRPATCPRLSDEVSGACSRGLRQRWCDGVAVLLCDGHWEICRCCHQCSIGHSTAIALHAVFCCLSSPDTNDRTASSASFVFSCLAPLFPSSASLLLLSSVMVNVEEWYRGLPPLTRLWLTGALITGVIFSFGIPIAPYLLLDWDAVLHHLQVWRLVTCFFVFGKISMSWVISIYMLCQYFRALEVNHYPGSRGGAELLFLTAFGCSCILLVSYFYHVFPSVSLLSMFIYIWSRRDPHDQIVIYGFTFQRWHLPAVLFVMQMVLGGISFDPVVAVLIGHLWVFLTTIVPRVYHRSVVDVPAWWYDAVETHVWKAIGGVPDRAPAVAVDPRIPRAAWMRGPGHRLDM